MTSNIALLIDAENVSSKSMPEVLQAVSRLGNIRLKVVYGNWGLPHLKVWAELAEKYRITTRPISNGNGKASTVKNAADMGLAMDAIEITFRVPEIDTFCIYTNDSDYEPLCNKLRKSKKYVVGIGDLNASDIFIRACNQFIFTENGTIPARSTSQQNGATAQTITPPKAKAPAPPKPKLSPLEKLVIKAFEQATPDKNGWVSMSALGTILRQVDGSFSYKKYGHSTMKKLLQSIPDRVQIKAEGGMDYAKLKK